MKGGPPWGPSRARYNGQVANLPLETRLPIAAGEVCLKIYDRHFIDRAGALARMRFAFQSIRGGRTCPAP